MPSVQSAILISASAEKVWATLTDFPRWQGWNTCFTDMQVHGSPLDPKVGTTLTFTTRISDPEKPDTSNARITHWVPGKAFTWVGGPSPKWLEWLIYGEHWFRVEEEEEEEEEEGGRTVVKTKLLQGENVRGCLSFLFPEKMRSRLIEMVETFNKELKKRVEEGS